MNNKFGKTTFFFAIGAMLLTSGILEGKFNDLVDPFVDPIQYEKPVAEAYEAPEEHPVNYADVDYDSIKKVIINYYNEDKKNNTREIYTWVTGNDSEYNALTLDDAEYAHITLDYTSTSSAYAGSEYLKFIVKYKDTWTGQSLDMELHFDEFPPDENGVVEVWTCNGDGGSIEIYATKAETQMEKVRLAYFTNWKTIRCEADAIPTTYRLYAYDKAYLASTDAIQKRIQPLRLLKEGVPTDKNFNIVFNYNAHINVQYVVETEYSQHQKIQRRIVTTYKLYNDPNFIKYYTYSGDDLGCTFDSETNTATFKVWAPTAGGLVVNVYNKGTPKGVISTGGGTPGSDIHKSYFMTMQPGGVWVKTLTGADLENKYYTYTVYNSEGVNEVCDPYAKACGVNGRRGMILDFNKTNPDGWNELPTKWDGSERDIKTPQELSIYEIHIRDLTEHESWNGNEANGTYKAFYEKGTRLKGNNTITTGHDHIEEMGFNAVQIMPMFDHDNNELFYYFKRNEKGEKTEQQMYVARDYAGQYKDELQLDFNWGYNPLNYNCIEGSYSSNPEDGAARVKEFKELVMSYANDANMTRVIMDVVYNHVSSVANCNFTKLMPRYFFRFNETKDEYYDGSGCSNEVKTEAVMARKFVVDSLCWWAKEYKVKGFRFDLMGLIDITTLNEARKALYKIDPDIYIYGEGWKALGESGLPESEGGFTANVYNKAKPASGSVILGCFNDAGRDSIRGGNDGGWGSGDRHPGYGFMSQGASDVGDKADKVRAMLNGVNGWQSMSQNPVQTVNYAACHDNFTLYDQFSWTLANGGSTTAKETGTTYAPAVKDVVQASTVCSIAVMMSNGAAFMLGGDELYRTKNEDHPEKSRLNEDYVKMYGTTVSHNSYKSSTKTNCFDWNRKVSIKGYKGDSINTKDYWTAIKAAVNARKQIAKANKFNDCNCNGDGNTTKVSFYIGGYVLIISGRGGSGLADWNIPTNNTEVAKVGTYSLGTASGGYRPITIANYSCALFKV